MRKPRNDEFVTCPDSRFHSQKSHKAVFDTVDTDGKTKISFGILGVHAHGYGVPMCKWTGLAV